MTGFFRLCDDDMFLCIYLFMAGFTPHSLFFLLGIIIEALARVEYISGKSIYFVEGDITCEDDLDKIFKEFSFWAVIHFAAIKAVGQSTEIPLEYYHNNVTGSLNLFRVMNRY